MNAMTLRATLTSTVGGVHETPKIGVLTPLTQAITSANFTFACSQYTRQRSWDC